MKLTRKKLRKIILSEIFENDAAAYKFDHKVDGRQSGSPHSHEYMFKTDDDLIYLVYIYAKSEYGEGRNAEKVWTGNWDVVFGTIDPQDPLKFSMNMTGKRDIKVLNTVIQVVKDFVSNVRPTLPDPLSTFTHFKCEAQQERSRPGRPMGTDSRRGRIYQYMLKKQGISSKLSLDEYGSVIIEFVI